MTGDEALVAALKRDWRTAELGDRLRAVLAFSEKLTRTPGEMNEGDVAALRQAGLGDDEILSVVLVAGFFNLATRIADGLGVELDPEIVGPGTAGTPR